MKGLKKLLGLTLAAMMTMSLVGCSSSGDNGESGEAADKLERVLDENKINEDALYDGYFCIITSELDYDYKKILEVYGSLWKIEESFRITKSDLEVRPIYVSNESRINGHFLTCYVALVLIRLLQYKMKCRD